MKSESLRSNAPSTKSSVRRSKRKKKSRDIVSVLSAIARIARFYNTIRLTIRVLIL